MAKGLMSSSHAHPSAVVDPGAQVGEGSKIWHFSHIASGALVGEHCTIGQNCYIAPTARLGDRVKLQNNVSVYDGVILEDDVFCGPSAVFTNVINPRAFVSRKDEYRTTRVERGATIGANATVICGVTLGEYSLVGAGAVVTASVPPHALVFGVPARQHGWVSRHGEILCFGEDGIATCSATGETYRATEFGVSLETPAA